MSPAEGRVLGLDLGSVRIGVAISDPLGITAQPLGVIERSGKRAELQRISTLVHEHEVHTVVIGLPLLLSGEESEGSAEARAYADRLASRLEGVTVELWDERLTSAEAERTMIEGGVRRGKRKRKVDTLAAILIVQSFLDARSGDA